MVDVDEVILGPEESDSEGFTLLITITSEERVYVEIAGPDDVSRISAKFFFECLGLEVARNSEKGDLRARPGKSAVKPWL